MRWGRGELGRRTALVVASAWGLLLVANLWLLLTGEQEVSVLVARSLVAAGSALLAYLHLAHAIWNAAPAGEAGEREA